MPPAPSFIPCSSFRLPLRLIYLNIYSLYALSPDSVQLAVVPVATEAVEVGDSGGVRDGQRRGMCEKKEEADEGEAGGSCDALCFFF